MNRHPKTIPIPHDPPHEVTIVKIPGRKLRDADEARDFHGSEYIEKMGGAAYRKFLVEQQAEQQAKRKAAGEPEPVSDPINAYDHDVLILAGVQAWTLTEEDGSKTPVTAEEIALLPAETRDFLAAEILRHTKPSLFADFDQDAAQKKAHASPSVS